MQKTFIIIILFFFYTAVFSQYDIVNYKVKDLPNYPVIAINSHVGYLINTFGYDTLPPRGGAYYQEIRLSRQTNGSKYWHHLYGYPEVGASIYMGFLGNSEAFGQVMGVVPHLTFSTLREKDPFWSITLGMGFSYFNKPFDSITNPHNIFIGTHVTNMSYFSFYMNKRLSQNLNLTFGISTNHTSNGHYQIPNVGINMPQLSFGLKYYPKGQPAKNPIKDWNMPSSKPRFNVRFGAGIHEFAGTIKPIGTPKYSIFVGSVYLSKRMGKLGNAHIGFDMRYYEGYYDYIVYWNTYSENQRLKASKIGVLMGYEFLIGHFGLFIQSGINLYNPFYNLAYKVFINRTFNAFTGSFIYNRLGVQYYLREPQKHTKNNLYFGMFINAKFGKADFPEIGIGYQF